MRLTSLALLITATSVVYAQESKVEIWEKPISPGLTYHMEVDKQTPLIVHALRFSQKTPGLRMIPELAGHTINEEGTVKGRLTPGQMATQSSAIAAINGDYFSFTQGAPIGLMIRNGEVIDTPYKARATFGWGPSDSRLSFCTISASITPEEGSETNLDSVNQPCSQNQLVLYTPAEGTAQVSGSHVAMWLTVPKGNWAPNSTISATVESTVPDSQEIKIPDGKALLVATGNKMPTVQGMTIGAKVSIQLQVQGFDWEKIENVIGGGPVLLKDGQISVDAESEAFPASFYAKRHPRTAIGRTSNGDVWLTAIDGRQEISAGATLEETAKVMSRLGCVDAMNLDGGGSTCMFLMGVTVNRPSDGSERPVSNGILILGPKLHDYSGELKLVVSPKLALTGKIAAHLTLDGATVPNSDVIWGGQGSAWIDQGGNLHPLELGKAKIRASAYGQILSADVTVVEKLSPGRKHRIKVRSAEDRLTRH